MVTSDFSVYPQGQIQDNQSMLQNGSSVTALTPAEQDEISLVLTELEKWALILSRLRGEQVKKLAGWLDEKIERLMTWGLMGTDEQRFGILERLTKLQDGPLSAHTILGRAIEQQLNALCKKLPVENGRISDFNTIDSDGEWFGESGLEVLIPAACRFPLAEARVYKSDDSCYPLTGTYALLIERNSYTLEERSKEGTPTPIKFVKKNVTSINLMIDVRMVIVRTDNGESWNFRFNDDTDAMTVAFYLVLPVWRELESS